MDRKAGKTLAAALPRILVAMIIVALLAAMWWSRRHEASCPCRPEEEREFRVTLEDEQNDLLAYREPDARAKFEAEARERPPDWDALGEALVWLARNQEPDGHWDARKHGGGNADPTATGLAALAFLKAGHSENCGNYRNNVRHALDWLMKQQDEDGCIGRGFERTGGPGLHHAICGTVLGEACQSYFSGYGQRRRIRGNHTEEELAEISKRIGQLQAAAQKAIDYSVSVHQVPFSGWGTAAGRDPDTITTAWFVMQLKSGKVAKLKVPVEAFQGAINWLDQVTDTEERPGTACLRPGMEPGAEPTAAAMRGRLLMGWRPDEPVVRGAADYLLTCLPSWGENGSEADHVWWFFGQYAMYQMHGDYWKKWNAAMKETLYERQNYGGPRKGSWDPAGPLADAGGRVYSTALAVLCLEVHYYRAWSSSDY